MNTEDDEFKRIEREATRGIPDAIHHTDTSESLEYITGWNDCRQAMLAEQPAPAQQEPVAHRDSFWCADLTCKKCYSADFRFRHKNSVVKDSLTTQAQTAPQAQPAQRKPLTDEDIDDLSRTMVKGNKSVNWLCRAIEVKLAEQPAQVEVCCGDYGKCTKPCTPRGKWLAEQATVGLPESETEEMHDAVMEVLYTGGVSRSNTYLLWEAYRKVLATTPQAPKEKQS